MKINTGTKKVATTSDGRIFLPRKGGYMSVISGEMTVSESHDSELSSEQMDQLVLRAAEDIGFYRQGRDDIVQSNNDTPAAKAFVALDSLRVFNER